jgi:predicted metalloprotease with PDZ domain
MATAQDLYNFTVDLIDVTNDQVKVTLITPYIKKNNTKFHFAKIIPGTYQVYDFGRFISDFNAYDRNNNSLEVEKIDVNTYKIKQAKALYKITYKVDDSYDLTEGKMVSGMSGTNIEADENFVLNGHGFYGYFEDLQFNDYRIKVLKPDGFKGSSAISPIESAESFETYEMPDFNFVVDTPMMFCKPDQTVTNVGNSEVLVSVYSPSGNVQSAFLAEKLKSLLLASKEYMGGKLPVEKYAFIMYFLKPGQHVGTGALEHNYSSLYALPDLPQEQILQPIINISAHEFFHVITPLNIHSKEIQFFDFYDPKMSMHLWLYEGVTEYFAHHSQYTQELTSFDEFLGTMAAKITASKSQYNDGLPFTELSEGALDTYRNEYGNVYQKGALIGFCLDIFLRKYSKENLGLMDLLNKLMKKYGNNNPFEDDKLFKEIAKLSYPEVTTFFERYVTGPNPLPLKSVFDEIGVALVEPSKYMGYSLGSPGLGFNPESKRIYVADTGNVNAFGKKIGYQVGDEFLAINGEKMPESGFHQYFQNITSSLKEGNQLTILVEREGKEIPLTTTIEKVELTKPAELKILENPSEEQLNFRKIWKQGSRLGIY